MLSCGILRGETSRTRLAPSGEESDTLTSPYRALPGSPGPRLKLLGIGIALTRWPTHSHAQSRGAFLPPAAFRGNHLTSASLKTGTVPRRHSVQVRELTRSMAAVSPAFSIVWAHHAFPSQLGACKRMRREQDGLSLVAELHRLIMCSRR